MNTATITNISTRTPYPFDATGLSPFESHPDRQIREEQGFYVPDLLSDAEFDADGTAHEAPNEHIKQQQAPELLVGDAWNLASLMVAAMEYECDSRAMQIDAGLRAIEKKLSQAHNQIDRLHRQQHNLFLAYFDLKNKPDVD